MAEAIVITKLMEAVLLKAAEFALKNVTARLSAKTTPADMTRALSAHFDLIGRWSRSVKFKDMTQSKALFSTFVELDLSVLPRRQAIDAQHGTHTTLLQLTDVGGHIVLLGDVGAGKTTSLKRLVLYHVDLYRADPELSPIPLLVELRDLRTSETVCERILAELNVQHAITATQRSHRFSAEDIETRQSMARSTTVEILSRMRFRVFLDGLDEVSPASRALMLHDIRDLMSRTSNSALLMTCRSGDYDVELDHAQVFELRPLTEPQIDDFAKKWLKETDRASNFLRQLRQSPYADTAVRPLTLAHLCVLFERNGDIPDKPKTTYRKIIQLLLEDWDKQHSVTRTSAYASFGPDRKQEFLERLAFDIRETRFSHKTLQEAYRRVCDDFGLPKREAEKVAREIESHTGLLVQTGFETYEFAHRSLHEYLCAEYIVGYPEFANAVGAFDTFASEYALAISLSTAPSRFMATVLFRCSMERVELASLDTFVRRLAVERPDFGKDPVLGCALLLLDHQLQNGMPAAMVREMTAQKAISSSLRAARELFEPAGASGERVSLRYLGGLESQILVKLPLEIRVTAGLLASWQSMS